MKLRGLRQVRQRSGLSISQLADVSGLRRETITHLEHGKEDPQSYVVRRLATALNTSTAELFGIEVLESAGISHSATGETAHGTIAAAS